MGVVVTSRKWKMFSILNHEFFLYTWVFGFFWRGLSFNISLIFDWHFFTLVPSSADKCNRDECSRTCQATLLVNDGWLQHSQHWSSVWYGTSTRNPSQTCRAATWRECLTTWFGTYFIMRIQFDWLVQLLYCTWKQAATGSMHWLPMAWENTIFLFG